MEPLGRVLARVLGPVDTPEREASPTRLPEWGTLGVVKRHV